jgi:hypothetical protein
MGALLITPAIEEIILDRLAEGDALRVICEREDIPVTEAAVRKRAIEDEDFGARYARAREIGYDCRGERAVEDAKAAKDAGLARLAFDAERWYLSKMKPKTYGEKVDVTSGGEKIDADPVSRVTRLAAIFAEIEKGRDASD